jgi:acyl-CoA synthetase (AMP-forming)/AMP-acid ligase II
MSWFEGGRTVIPDVIRLNAEWRGNQAAVRAGEEELSWKELAEKCDRMANGLAELGLMPGDRVVVLMQNSMEMLVALLGSICGGYVAVPLNVAVSDEGIELQIKDCAAAALIVSTAHAQRIESMLDALPAAARTRNILAGEARAGWLDFATLLQTAESRRAGVPISPGQACNIIYSSGTTGLPKGIVHSHQCRMAWAYDMSIALRYHSDARTLLSLGLYSNITWVAMLNTILCGGTLVIARSFSAEDCLATIEVERITHSAMVPVQFQRLLEVPQFDHYDLGSIESLMCCGSPLHVDLKKEILARFPGDFIELYGLTEGLVTIQSPTDAAELPESVGKPCPGQHLVILGDDDEPVPAGEAGEIAGYGSLLMSGYLNRDDESASATWTDSLGRRWLRTGDIGRVDKDGNLFIVDRKKDLIISGGQNIYPADIEAVIAMHPQVSDVAVVGVASRKWGESPIAVVCGQNVDAEMLLDWVNGRLGRQQRVAAVQIVDELPRNPNGKILKRELRDRFATVLQARGD